jgi:anaerobic selenocysteine-containing dehydrogenase
VPVLRSVCPLDCPDACAVLITVEGDRVTRLQGDPAHPITRGFACAKTHRYPERQHHPDRLTHPLVRAGAKGDGRFQRASWDEALDLVAERTRDAVDRWGAESVLPYHYAGTMGHVEGGHPLAFFRALGASELDATICAATGGAGWEANYGPHKLGTDPEDVRHAKLILLWGIDAARSNVHLMPEVQAARRQGAFVLHVDPYRNATTRSADEHWQLVVGSDTAVALAMGHVILRDGLEDRGYLARHARGLDAYRRAVGPWTPERAATVSGLDPLRIEEVARHFATAGAAYVRVGYGMTRNEGGGNAVRAITLLPALTGAWRHRGGGGAISTSGAFRLGTARTAGRHLLRPGVRHVNQNRLASALGGQDGPPIAKLFVFNSNPAAVAPDSVRVRAGLRRADLFTTVLEHFQTDTADFADVLLPATTFLEHPDLYGAYGHYHLQWAEPVIEPLGEARPNTWVFRELGRRLGLTDPTVAWSAEDVARDLLASGHPHLAGITFEALREARSMKLRLPSPFRPYADGSHHPDRKVAFDPAPEVVAFEEQPSPSFPLRLISPPGTHVLNTSMGNVASLLKAAGGEPWMLLHPADAARFGVTHGVRHRIVSAQGSIVRRIDVSDAAREGVLVAVGQWWPKLAPDGRSLNDLTSERLTDLGGGSTFGNVTVRVERL